MARESNEPARQYDTRRLALKLGLGLGLTTMASATNLGNQKCSAPAPTTMSCAAAN